MNIDNSAELTRFKTHLDLEGNNQIIFSGIFGIGKTHFIKEFKEAHTSDYHILLLSPINYSISSTDDIINYIKYDIAFELLRNGETLFEKDEFSIALTSQFYVLRNLPPIISGISKMSGLLGKPLEDLLKPLKAWKKVVDDIKEDNANLKIDDKKEIIQFLANLNIKEGSIYEENNITELIACLVESLKKEDKKVVLILDDVDRLDPEHIFRILNVFACHFDFGSSTGNKFNVDKVILVCDIENIRQIFHAKYGLNVDFSGYIDKFYSQEVFYFDNKEALRKAVKNAIMHIEFKDFDSDYTGLSNPENSTFFLLETILISLINNNLLSLRNLLAITRQKILFKHFSFQLMLKRYDNHQLNISFIWSILISLYGSPSTLITILKKHSERAPLLLPPFKDLLNDLIILLDSKVHILNEGQHGYTEQTLKLSIDYNIKYLRINTNSQDFKITSQNIRLSYLGISGGSREFDLIPFAPLLEIAFANYMTLGKDVL